MSNLTVVIPTKNEENNILDSLESVKSADEIIIIDDYSDDRTVEIVKKFDNKVKIYSRNLDNDFSAQRNFGLSKASLNWVLFLDADERVSNELMKEIEVVISENILDGFLIRRKDIIWGRKLEHGETGNIRLLRLAKKSKGIWEGKVHETWNVKGKIGTLKHEILHFPHQNIKEFLREVNLYSSMRARELKETGEKVSGLDIIFYPKLKFIKNFFIKLGFLDGTQGLVVAIMMSFHSFLVRSKLWMLQNEK